MLFDNYQLYQDRLVLNHECAEFMLGGTEALTYNLVHVFHGLMSNPDTMAKLRKELDELQAIDGHAWNDSLAPSMKYLVRTGRSLLVSQLTRCYVECRHQ